MKTIFVISVIFFYENKILNTSINTSIQPCLERMAQVSFQNTSELRAYLQGNNIF